MNIRTLSRPLSVLSNVTPSSRMSAGVLSQSANVESNGLKQAESQGNLAAVIRIGRNELKANPFGSVHPRSSSLCAHRSLTETGRRLGGLSADEVRAQIEDGPLVGRVVNGELVVHDSDLADFLALRRPRLVGGAW